MDLEESLDKYGLCVEVTKSDIHQSNSKKYDFISFRGRKYTPADIWVYLEGLLPKGGLLNYFKDISEEEKQGLKKAYEFIQEHRKKDGDFIRPESTRFKRSNQKTEKTNKT